MRILTKLTIGLVAVLGLAFTAVSVASGAQGGGQAAGQAAGKAISIKDFKYNPADLAVKVGEKVTVTNSDAAPHTVTARDGSLALPSGSRTGVPQFHPPELRNDGTTDRRARNIPAFFSSTCRN
jgi:plastocyanin